jgi:hypothetical protein
MFHRRLEARRTIACKPEPRQRLVKANFFDGRCELMFVFPLL